MLAAADSLALPGAGASAGDGASAAMQHWVPASTQGCSAQGRQGVRPDQTRLRQGQVLGPYTRPGSATFDAAALDGGAGARPDLSVSTDGHSAPTEPPHGRSPRRKRRPGTSSSPSGPAWVRAAAARVQLVDQVPVAVAVAVAAAMPSSSGGIVYGSGNGGGGGGGGGTGGTGGTGGGGGGGSFGMYLNGGSSVTAELGSTIAAVTAAPA